MVITEKNEIGNKIREKNQGNQKSVLWKDQQKRQILS